jgi:hypothetical protein
MYKKIIAESKIEFNELYLIRYFKFISKFSEPKKTKFKTEFHHILPSCLFKEYQNLSIFCWNGVHLSSRAHYIAHLLLMKCFPTEKKLAYVYYAMSNKNGHKINSRIYEKAKTIAYLYLKETRTGTKLSTKTKLKIKEYTNTRDSRESNIWRQLNTSQFKSFKELEDKIMQIHKRFWDIPFLIGKEINIPAATIESILRLNGIDVILSQKKTKAYKLYGHRFKTYHDYLTSIKLQHEEGNSVYVVSEILDIRIGAVLSALREQNITPNKQKRKSGPSENSKKCGMKKGTHIWITNGKTNIRNPIDSVIKEGFRKGRTIKVDINGHV